MLDYGGFYLKGDIGNNSFSYPYDKEHQLWVPFLKDISYSQFEDQGVSLGNLSVFSEVNSDGKLQEYLGLDSFYCFEKDGVSIYIFDNHNHAYAFWRREIFKGVLKKGIYLLHIDQHSDMNENKFQLERETWEDVIQFTNQCCNVGNFIIPAVDCGIVNEVKQLRTEQGLLCFNKPHMDYLLDIDLDFWDEKMGITDIEGTLKKTRSLIQSAKMVTVATSPYFLNQGKAIELVNALF